MQNVTKQTGGKIPSFPVNHISHPEWEKLAILACASMRDPAAEIQALRDAVKESRDAFEDLMGLIPDVPPWAHTEAKLALAKLKALA